MRLNQIVIETEIRMVKPLLCKDEPNVQKSITVDYSEALIKRLPANRKNPIKKKDEAKTK